MPLADRPFAQRPHNMTAHRELKLFHLRWNDWDGSDGGQAPHLFVTTSRGEIEVKPLRDDELLALNKQIAAIVEARFRNLRRKP